MDEVDKSLTKEFFGNNAAIYQAALMEGHRYATSWHDIATASRVLPELEINVHNVILRLLGYLPHISVRLKYEPAIRAIGQSFRWGGLSDDELFSELEQHIKPMRNEEMSSCLALRFDERDYLAYEQSWLPYGQAVRSRLAGFLGYEPELRHSLIAEMWLRDIFSKDTFKLPEEITEIDYKAINLISYREVLLSQGKAEADTSPLVAIYVRTRLMNKV